MRDLSIKISRKFADSLLLILAIGFYGTALILPTWLCASHPLTGAWVLKSGWLGLLMLEPRWLCNLLPVFALGSFFAGQRIIPWWASAMIAIVAATTLFGPYLCGGNAGSLGNGTGPASGQLFWIASMFLFALWDPRGLKKTHRAPPTNAPAPSNWILGTVMALNLKQLASLCVGYYQLKGFTVRNVTQTPDGAIAIALHKQGIDKPIAIVLCKIHNRGLNHQQVESMRALLKEQGVARGIVWFSPGYAGEQMADSTERSGIQLLDGVAIVKRIRMLNGAAQETLWKRVQV